MRGTEWGTIGRASSLPVPCASQPVGRAAPLSREAPWSPGCGRGPACGRAEEERPPLAGMFLASDAGPYIICGGRTAFRELTISNLIALEYTMQARLPADSEITKNGLLGDICYRSFLEEIREDVAAPGSFGRSFTTVSRSVFGPCEDSGCGREGR